MNVTSLMWRLEGADFKQQVAAATARFTARTGKQPTVLFVRPGEGEEVAGLEKVEDTLVPMRHIVLCCHKNDYLSA